MGKLVSVDHLKKDYVQQSGLEIDLEKKSHCYSWPIIIQVTLSKPSVGFFFLHIVKTATIISKKLELTCAPSKTSQYFVIR